MLEQRAYIGAEQFPVVHMLQAVCVCAALRTSGRALWISAWMAFRLITCLFETSTSGLTVIQPLDLPTFYNLALFINSNHTLVPNQQEMRAEEFTQKLVGSIGSRSVMWPVSLFVRV